MRMRISVSWIWAELDPIAALRTLAPRAACRLCHSIIHNYTRTHTCIKHTCIKHTDKKNIQKEIFIKKKQKYNLFKMFFQEEFEVRVYLGALQSTGHP